MRRFIECSYKVVSRCVWLVRYSKNKRSKSKNVFSFENSSRRRVAIFTAVFLFLGPIAMNNWPEMKGAGKSSMLPYYSQSVRNPTS